MKKIKCTILAILIYSSLPVKAQVTPVDSVQFFTDEGMIDISLTTDFRGLQNEKGKSVYQDAEINCRFPDSSLVNEKIEIAARGHFRRDNCTLPPLLLNFRNNSSPRLSSLGKLKLVIACGSAAHDEQVLLKEYLVYKMYNLLEEKSFRVRLVRVSFRDIKDKIRSFTQYAFFIEDDKDMAGRNGCKKNDKALYQSENTNREIMTKVALFQYMISNGDWSVPGNHNIKLIFSKRDLTVPFAVPYDFDQSGFVNADYATPDPQLETDKVTDRVYRGFTRNMDELQATLEIFRNKKEAILSLINNFQFLKEINRKDAVKYLNEFYKIISEKNLVQSIFINNARIR